MPNHPLAILGVCVFLLAGLAGSGFYFYKSWFDVDSLRKMLRKHYAGVPAWLPYGAIMRNMLNRSGLIWQIRIASTIAFIGMIGFITTIVVLIVSGVPIRIYFDK